MRLASVRNQLLKLTVGKVQWTPCRKCYGPFAPINDHHIVFVDSHQSSFVIGRIIHSSCDVSSKYRVPKQVGLVENRLGKY